MKALSIHPEYAMDIALGYKEEEYRSWKTDYRGPLLICSSVKPITPCSIPGHAVCVVDLVAIRKDGEKDYAWILKNPTPIKPIPVKGKLHIYEVDDALITKAPFSFDTTKEEKYDWLSKNYFPMMREVEQYEDGHWDVTQKAKENGYDAYSFLPIEFAS